MKKTVWDSMLDADMNVRYWSHLCRHYSKWDKYSKIFLAVMSSGTVASWGIWSEYKIIWKILSAITAIIAIALPILNWQKSIEIMSGLTVKWTKIKNEYESLWIKIKENIGEMEIECEKIKAKEIEVVQHESNLPHNNKLLLKCYDEVLKSRGLIN